jgi:hypothetical protein
VVHLLFERAELYVMKREYCDAAAALTIIFEELLVYCSSGSRVWMKRLPLEPRVIRMC